MLELGGEGVAISPRRVTRCTKRAKRCRCTGWLVVAAEITQDRNVSDVEGPQSQGAFRSAS